MISYFCQFKKNNTMKQTSFILILISALLILPGVSFAQKKCEKKCEKKCRKKESKTAKVVLTNNTDTISYIIGSDIARSFKSNDVIVNFDVMNMGIHDAMNGADTIFTQEQIQQIMTEWNQRMMKERQDREQQSTIENRKKGDEYLAENKKKEGVVELPSGLQYKVIREGSGVSPADTSMVKVDYVGTLIDGTVFDSSRDRGEPIEFAVNGVIPGWTEALKLMKPGAVYMLYIPADLAYGDRKMGKIPPGSTLIFEVELYAVVE